MKLNFVFVNNICIKHIGLGLVWVFLEKQKYDKKDFTTAVAFCCPINVPIKLISTHSAPD